MADWSAGLSFVRSKGNEIEQARLRYLVSDEMPSQAIRAALLDQQRSDGGWAPFWAYNYSGVDATCFRLAQAAQLGILGTDSAVRDALNFLVKRQHTDGFWEEDQSVAEIAPRWAKPNDTKARLYLTANVGFWIVVLDGEQPVAERAASYIEGYLDRQGHLNSFLHTYWLAGSLLWRLGRYSLADRLFSAIHERLRDLNASNLAWLGLSLLAAGVPPMYYLVRSAGEALDLKQESDGHWSSEDGPEWNVHSTLEALRFLQAIGCRESI